MITLVEVTKTVTKNNDSFFYQSPFVYQTVVSVPADFTSYFIDFFGAEDELSRQRVFIKAVSYLGDRYTVRSSLGDCESLEKSFFYDLENQTLYIHIDHSLPVIFSMFSILAIDGFTNNGVKDFNGIPYIPEVLSIPPVVDNVDPVDRSKIKFNTGTVVFNNKSIDQTTNAGAFDSRDLQGQNLFIFYGADDATYSELTQAFSFYVLNQNVNFNECAVAVRDNREKFNTKIPTERFNTNDFPDIGEDKIDQVKPLFLGEGLQVPGICIDEDSGTGAKNFRFSDTITSMTQVEVKKNEKWTVVTPLSVNNSTGTITLSQSDSHVDGDITRGILDCRADGIFENYTNPGDQIEYLNQRYLNIPFDASSYDTTEWAAENALLADTGIYLNKFKDLFQYVEDLQNGSDVGFNYEVNGAGLITMRIDNPNRDSVATVQAVEIRNNENIEKNNNFTLYYSSAIIKHSKRWDSESFREIKNDDFKAQVLQANGGKENIYENNSLLTAEADAEDKAAIVLDDTKDNRPIWTIELFGAKWFSIRKFDILNAYLSYPGEISGERINGVYTINETSIIEFAKTENSTTQYRRTEKQKEDIIINQREFDGLRRVQVIGRRLDFDNEIIEITLREKPYSDVFFNIKGI